ncbi:acyl carrier protein [Hymenobacter metallilatus]|uniref:Carrier domain-containing protein n=1 Tax=Hymenobacter metallilatus TaxID=2493666 RepID=A0A3R9PED7_9BACT|nr:hypothetical protein [Hymenobacter metallilatus]RSK35315.1 hypothetical protein EI290_06350 [Hymenobacter metallilatus]
MGLDTVELVVKFEKYFQIQIPNRVAESIYTVADAAAVIARLKHLPADPARTAAYYQLLTRLLDCLHPGYSPATEATLLTDLDLLDTNLTQAQPLAHCLQLHMPDLPRAAWEPGLPGWWQRLFGSGKDESVPDPPPLSPDWARTTVADLTEWLLAQNYAQLLPQPATLYEVQRAVIGITCAKCGVPVPEIKLADSFTDDLGMD